MPDHKHRKKTLLRTLKWLLTLLILGVVGLLAWIYLIPMITADAVTVYDSYTVQTGDIHTTKSFSATLSVKKSETFTTSEECTVREIYVQSGDEVKKGDQLILLSTGELFTASFEGVVNEIRVKAGDWLWRNFTVVQICDLEHLEVSMNVDEYDVKELSIGQACTVSVISLGMDFDTAIAHINRVSQAQGNVAFYSVTCDLTVPENVLPGMQATVTLASDSVAGVVTLDIAALAFDENRDPFVLVKQSDGTYVETPVETGLSDGMTVEIKSGLSAGQTVYAVAGTESVKAAVTLEDLYQMIVGQKVVINDQSSRGGPGEGGPPSGDMPQGDGTGTLPAMGETSADGTATDATAATDAATSAQPAAADGTATDATAATDAATSAQPAATDAGTADTAASATGAGTPPQGLSGQQPQTNPSSDAATDAATTTDPEGGSTDVQ
ncbi:MAG: HlyD family efflux transporter periplasmic adaptor subunit [Clostridiales bacterium]|nr:HlyD family efflux transporter periplasmic adaptor subunit [Clostridiales bacterium]